jgi:four helix bundle protein
MEDRRNINRGFKKSRVWQDAMSLYVLTCEILKNSSFELKKTVANAIDSSHSISRNIAEGYRRRSIKEYLNFLNISLGSCGEFHSSYFSFRKANQISESDFEELDKLHYKVENQLIKLIESLQNKKNHGKWKDSFA